MNFHLRRSQTFQLLPQGSGGEGGPVTGGYEGSPRPLSRGDTGPSLREWSHPRMNGSFSNSIKDWVRSAGLETEWNANNDVAAATGSWPGAPDPLTNHSSYCD